MERFAAFEDLSASGPEAADAESAVAEWGGWQDQSPIVNSLIFGERELDLQF